MTVETEWQSYALQAIHRDAPRVQYLECRRAFYAGVMAGVRLVEIETDNLVIELEGFKAAVLRGEK